MTPTAKLRFVERSVPMHPFYKTTDAQGNLVQATQTYRVLQQWWIPTCQEGCEEVIDYRLPTERWIKNVEGAGEWRDVPLEVEA